MKKAVFVFFILTGLASGFLAAENSGLEEGLNRAAALFEGTAESVPLTLALGPVTAGEKGSGTEFSEYLRGRLSGIISASLRLRLVERDRMDLVIDELKLSLSGLLEETGAPEAGNLAAARAMITGHYLEEGTEVRVFLRMVSVETGGALAAFDFSFPKADIPGGIALKSDNHRDAQRLVEELSSVTGRETFDFQVRLWTARGDGAVYTDGEELAVKFFSNKDCYLRIYQIDVNGRAQLIFPNPYSGSNAVAAERIYTIPGPGYPFRFVLGPPYGVEYIKAVASTTPFEDTGEAFTDLGQASGKLVTRGLKVIPRETLTAEAITGYTIIKKEARD